MGVFKYLYCVQKFVPYVQSDNWETIKIVRSEEQARQWFKEFKARGYKEKESKFKDEIFELE